MSGISKFLGDAYQYLSKFYDTGAIIKVVEFVAWGFKKLGSIIGSVFANLVNMIYGAFSGIVQRIGALLAPLIKPLQKVVDFVKSMLSTCTAQVIAAD